jgi:hypothetical protein
LRVDALMKSLLMRAGAYTRQSLIGVRHKHKPADAAERNDFLASRT